MNKNSWGITDLVAEGDDVLSTIDKHTKNNENVFRSNVYIENFFEQWG